MPTGFVSVFGFGFFLTSLYPVCSTSASWPWLSPCLLGFDDPTMFLNIDLIYSTNVWEEWEQNFLFVWDADWVLKRTIIYANNAPSPPLFQVFPPKGYVVRLPVRSGAQSLQRARGHVRGRRQLHVLSVFCSWNGSVWVWKLLFLNGGIDDFILVGGWDCGFKTNGFWVGCIFCWIFCWFIFLESSTATWETMEKPRDLYQLIVLFVNLYKW